MIEDMAGSVALMTNVPLGKRERSKQEKRARIIQAAREVFSEKGFDAATTQEISQRAEIATGTLFLYAATKEELLLIVFADDMEQVLSGTEQQLADNQPVLDQLMLHFGRLTAYHEAVGRSLSAHQLKTILYTPRKHLADVTSALEKNGALLRRALEQGKRSGELRARLSVPRAMEALLSAWHWQLTHWAIGNVSMDEMMGNLRTILETYVRGMSRTR